VSCWHPVNMGAAIANDDGAIIVIPLVAPARKAVPMVVTLVGIVTDSSPV
jgi:hypothetical protein